MQLESTLFGVLVLHIKPQLEKLLNLFPDALTKEVALQQELMDLFIKHQIPADLLSAPEDALPGRGKLDAVKSNVAAVRAMIKRQEDEDIAHRAKEELYQRPLAALEQEYTPRIAAMNEECAAQMAMPMMAMARGGGGAPMMAKMAAPMRRAAMPQARMMAAAAPSPPVAFAPQADFCGGSSSFGFSAGASAPAPAPGGGAPAPGGGGGGGGGNGAGPGAAAPRPVTAAPGAAADAAAGGAEEDAEDAARDLTKVPVQLDGNYERLDPDSALRATIIAPNGAWAKKSWASILSKEPKSETLGSDEQKSARAAAFDLLDALSRSGALPMEHAALHVVMGAVRVRGAPFSSSCRFFLTPPPLPPHTHRSPHALRPLRRCTPLTRASWRRWCRKASTPLKRLSAACSSWPPRSTSCPRRRWSTATKWRGSPSTPRACSPRRAQSKRPPRGAQYKRWGAGAGAQKCICYAFFFLCAPRCCPPPPLFPLFPLLLCKVPAL